MFPKQSLEDWNMYITHMEYKYISHVLEYKYMSEEWEMSHNKSLENWHEEDKWKKQKRWKWKNWEEIQGKNGETTN